MIEGVSRRRALSMVGMTAAAAALWRAGVLTSRCGLPDVVADTRFLMGTVVNLSLCGGPRPDARAAITAVFQAMASLEQVFSRHRPDSDVSRLSSAGEIHDPNAALLDVLRLAERVSDASGGAFDVTVRPLLAAHGRYRASGSCPPPDVIRRTLACVDYRQLDATATRITLGLPGMGVTLDGIAKGYVVDRGVAVLRALGFEHVLVEAGGDLVASGTRAPDRAWRVGVQAPRREAGHVLVRMTLRDRATATSGDYLQPYSPDLRHHHVIDPRTGYSPPDLASATVVAADAATADALSTAVMVLGADEGLALADRWPGAEALVVDKALRVRQTAGFPEATSGTRR